MVKKYGEKKKLVVSRPLLLLCIGIPSGGLTMAQLSDIRYPISVREHELFKTMVKKYGEKKNWWFPVHYYYCGRELLKKHGDKIW
jgi:hypothetical protein